MSEVEGVEVEVAVAEGGREEGREEVGFLPLLKTTKDAVAADERFCWRTWASLALVGVSSWITVNATWVELPILASSTPEGYGIANQMSLALQAANLGPLLYEWHVRRQRDERRPWLSMIWMALAVGFLASVLQGFLWDKVSTINGSRHSVALLVLVLLSGTTDCMSTVTYWPMCSNFPARYAAALSFGEGLSSLLPGLMGIVQAPEQTQPRISVESFFVYFVGGMMLLSGFGFWCVTRLLATRERGHRALQVQSWAGGQPPGAAITVWGALPHRIRVAIVVLGVLSFVSNGVVVSVSTYALLPFSHGKTLLFWAGFIGMAADPLIAAVPTTRVRVSSATALSTLSAVVVAGAALVVAVALLLHDNSGLQNSQAAAMLTATAFVVMKVVTAFTKSCCFVVVMGYFRAQAYTTVQARLGADAPPGAKDDSVAASGARMTGLVVQATAAAGAIVMFLLTTVFNVFKE